MGIDISLSPDSLSVCSDAEKYKLPVQLSFLESEAVNIILSAVAPSKVPVHVERRSSGYLSVVGQRHGDDFCRVKVSERTKWFSLDISEYGDDPRLSTVENKNQRHWKIPLYSISDLLRYSDLVLKSCELCAARDYPDNHSFSFHSNNISGVDSPKGTRPGKGSSVSRFVSDYTAIDIETTGLDPKYCSIIELAAVRYRNGTPADSYDSLVNCPEGVDAFIEQLTGITNDMLKSSPPISDVMPAFLSFVGDDLIVGHNANFDINFIYDKSSKLGLPAFHNDYIDTMLISRKVYPDFTDYRLKTLVQNFGLSNENEHRAGSDASITAKCYEHIKKYVVDNKIDYEMLYAPIHSKIRASDISSTATEFDESSPLFGKVFVFTGVLDQMQRQEAMQLVANHGGINGDNVTKKTNFLVLGNNDFCTTIKDGKSSKQKKAEKLKLSGNDIEIISENVFYDMLEE